MPPWWEELFDERYFEFYEQLAKPVTADADAEFIERALALAAGARILDLGCGQGRHAVALALRGYSVTGLDLSPFLLDRARELAAQREVQVSWEMRDMRDTAGLGPFDACVSLCTAFGYFADEEDIRVLEGARDVLKPGGKLLIDLDNPYPLLRRMPFDIWAESPRHVTRSHMSYDPILARRITTRVLRPTKGGLEELPTSSVRLYFPQEVSKTLALCGFEPEGVYGRMDDEPYEWRQSARMIWTAVRSH